MSFLFGFRKTITSEPVGEEDGELKQLVMTIKAKKKDVDVEAALDRLVELMKAKPMDENIRVAVFKTLQDNRALPDLTKLALEGKNGSPAKAKALVLFAVLVQAQSPREPIYLLTPPSALLKVVKGEEVGSEVKHSALGVLSNLCTDPAIRSKMYSDVLIKEVTKVLVEESKGSEVRRFALLFLTNFCADAVNRFKAYSDGLMKALIKVLSEEDNNGEVKRAAFMLITNLAADTTNKIVMLSDALMGEMLRVLREEKRGSKMKLMVIKLMINLSTNNTSIAGKICSEAFLGEMLTVMRQERTGSEVKELMLLLMINLSLDLPTAEKMMSDDLMKELTRATREEDKESSIKKHAVGLMRNLAVSSSNRPKMCSEEVLTELIKVGSEEVVSDQVVDAFATMNSLSVDGTLVKKMCSSDALMKLLVRVCASESSKVVKNHAIEILVNFSLDPSVREELNQAKIDDVFERVLKTYDGQDRIAWYALLGCGNLLNDEERVKQLNFNPETVQRMIEYLHSACYTPRSGWSFKIIFSSFARLTVNLSVRQVLWETKFGGKVDLFSLTCEALKQICEGNLVEEAGLLCVMILQFCLDVANPKYKQAFQNHKPFRLNLQQLGKKVAEREEEWKSVKTDVERLVGELHV